MVDHVSQPIPYIRTRVCILGLPFPGRLGIPVIFCSRIPGNGTTLFPSKTGMAQLTALLSFSVVATCSIEPPVQRLIDESLLDAVTHAVTRRCPAPRYTPQYQVEDGGLKHRCGWLILLKQ